MNENPSEELLAKKADMAIISCFDNSEAPGTLMEGQNDSDIEVSKRVIEIDNEGNVRVMLRVTSQNDGTKVLEDEPSPMKLIKRPRFLCPVCKKKGIVTVFKSNSSLSIHVQKVHIAQEHTEEAKVEIKPLYQCSICYEDGVQNVRFESRSKYQNHLVIQHHTYIFICAICSDSFKLKANYKAHLLTHNVPRVKPFECEVCHGRFVNRAGFDAHCRRFPGPHAKHTCPRCDISFSKSSHIKNHRCKRLLLEQARCRASGVGGFVESANDNEKMTFSPVKVEFDSSLSTLNKVGTEISEDSTGMENRVAGQVLQIGVTPSQQIYQVNVADWSLVAPYVIRDNVNVTSQPNSAIYAQPP